LSGFNAHLSYVTAAHVQISVGTNEESIRAHE